MCNFAPNDKQPMNKQDWTYKKLGEVATFINGYPFKPSDWKDSGRKIIRIQNLNNPNAVYNFYDGSIDPKYLVSNGDVLISWSGSLGVFEWTEDEAILNQHIFKVVFNKEYINKKFFQYVVASRINEMKSKVHGVTMQHITKKEFDIILIPVPPIGEQERIVAELDLLQGIIEKKKEQLKAYDQLAQSIFYSMFGDPIDNPKGWETKKLSENVHEMFLGPFGSALKVDSYVPKEESYCMVYEQKHAIQATINLDNHFINKDKFESLQRFEVKPHDFIMSCRGTIGRLYQLPENAPKGIIHPSLMKIRIKEEFYNSAFFQFLLVKIVANESTNGNCVQMAITAKELGKKELPIPPLSLQQEFAEKVEAIERQKGLVRRSIEETQTMFDFTMDKYFG